MANTDFSYYILRYDPTTSTVQYFNGGTWYDTITASTNITSAVLTGFSAGAGTVSATDTILTAFNKVVGNAATIPNLSVTPAKISTTATDDFSFPRDVTVGRNLLMTGSIGTAAGNRLTTNHPGFQIIMTSPNDTGLEIDMTNATAAVALQVRDNSGTVVANIFNKGILSIGNFTTVQRDALTPTEGWTIYNTDNHAPEWYNGTAWKTVAAV